MDEISEKICPKCYTSFSCGSACWCSDFPRIMPMNSSQGCLCRDCLKKNVLKRIGEWMNHLTFENSIKIKELGRPNKLIEDIDYTFNEKNQMVLSAWFLMRKGECCRNGCTNCPYDKIKIND